MFLQAKRAFPLCRGSKIFSTSIQHFLASSRKVRQTQQVRQVSDEITPTMTPSNAVPSSRTPVTIISNRFQAQKAIKILEANADAIWACDTEVADINVKEQSPVGNGKVICVSVYGGDHVDFGTGSTLWIENDGDSDGVLQEFKSWFENPLYKKVWHNYGFDRHVMNNEGIRCKGFAGDTMQMAKLWDSSREIAFGGGDGYSLSSLTKTFFSQDHRFVKTSMKELFGFANLIKESTPSKIKDVPDLRSLQQSPELRVDWIEYSARDAVATWWVFQKLETKLKEMPWVVEGFHLGNLYDFYQMYLKDFRELLTDMESNGIKVDKNRLHLAEVRAREDKAKMEKIFMDWAIEVCPDAKYMNITSTAQIQQLLFGHYKAGEFISSERVFKIEKSEEDIKAETNSVRESNPYAAMNSSDLRNMCKDRGLKITGKKSDLIQSLQRYDTKVQEIMKLEDDEVIRQCVARSLEIVSKEKFDLAKILASSEFRSKKKAVKALREASPEIAATSEASVVVNNDTPKKYRKFTIKSIEITPIDFTPTRMPRVTAGALNKLAGKNLFGDEKDAALGIAFYYFKNPEEGKKACKALGALAAVGQIDSIINKFFAPLQALVDENSRFHCSLNPNTETGKLSSRRPNLQNQPALETDQFKIRDAFVAEEGKTLIVAEYPQLELRIVAHFADCKSMIEDFAQGGCFHSRTAVRMYDYIKKAVDSGEVILEWDYSKGQPTVPLVKNAFAIERTKAKALNLAIANAKAEYDQMKDREIIAEEEIEKTLEELRHYPSEVKEWRRQTIVSARKVGYVHTIMGRHRILPGGGVASSITATDTTIQGSAADIVMMALIQLWKSEVLESLGWKLLLQVNDEVILEGPKETKEQAMKEVRRCMENPFNGFGPSKLPNIENISEAAKAKQIICKKVHFLNVDVKSADSWYEAK